MTQSDFDQKLKILAHTARYYFKVRPGTKELLLRQGVRLRQELLAAKAVNGALSLALTKQYSELAAFRQIALAEEKRLAQDFLAAQTKKLEAREELSRKNIKFQEEQFLKSIIEFDDDATS